MIKLNKENFEVAEFTTKTAGYRISELLRFGLDVFYSLNIYSDVLFLVLKANQMIKNGKNKDTHTHTFLTNPSPVPKITTVWSHVVVTAMEVNKVPS